MTHECKRKAIYTPGFITPAASAGKAECSELAAPWMSVIAVVSFPSLKPFQRGNNGRLHRTDMVTTIPITGVTHREGRQPARQTPLLPFPEEGSDCSCTSGGLGTCTPPQTGAGAGQRAPGPGGRGVQVPGGGSSSGGRASAHPPPHNPSLEKLPPSGA